jgi:Zn-dependent protease/predicted transcriptional regulator
MSYLPSFLKHQLKVASICNVPILIDYRWFIVLIISSWLIAANIPFTGNWITQLVLGLLSTVLLFASILLHELSHAWIAKKEGIKVLEIILHPFGGMAKLEKEPQTPKAEFRIAIAGPMMSLAISLFFLLMLPVARVFESPILMSISALLFFANTILAIFNLLPGYPLDGGRVFRAILWRKGISLNRATTLTGKVGQIIGITLIAFGLIVLILRADLTIAIWSSLLGLFLFDIANKFVKNQAKLKSASIEKLMKPTFSVSPEISISEFIERVLPLSRQSIFPVAKDKKFYGLLLLEDLKSLEKKLWTEKRVQDLMRPVQNNFFIKSDASLDEARRLIRENSVKALGVIDNDGNLIGFLQNQDLNHTD